jgi:hypothetical protein
MLSLDSHQTTCSKCGTAGQPDALWCVRCGSPLGKQTDASKGMITEVNQVITRGLFGLSSPRCKECGTKGRIVKLGMTIVTKERGMGVVTRTDTITKTVDLPSGDTRRETTEVNREERVPVVRGTMRNYYRCSACGHAWTKSVPYETEDTGPIRDQKTVLLTKEVTKVPCKYCGNLVNLNEFNVCPRCGGRLY